ncbi:hypothetical protein QTI66_31085 [Variovorax sp. J22R133]|uniref:hypothetical protein n=1 Tax=Variovorax brevis TaxID=3053503 RepID=UPI00257527A6|nr:hypothetical protein [Variovorax sp. J22R133]MDM0116592.1 hypothetical protein [Variovorax sp. J22R133]
MPLGRTRTNEVAFTSRVTSVDHLLCDDEWCCPRRLVEHLIAHAGHYLRANWLAETTADRAVVRLDDWKMAGGPLPDMVASTTLLEVDGEYLVMPSVAGASRALDRALETRSRCGKNLIQSAPPPTVPLFPSSVMSG